MQIDCSKKEEKLDEIGDSDIKIDNRIIPKTADVIIDDNDKNNNSKEELKQNKINIFLNMNSNNNNNYNYNKPPNNRKVDKGKIMSFLSDVLVNEDNTPSYVNFFQSIKQKSKEKLEIQNKSNNIISLHK